MKLLYTLLCLALIFGCGSSKSITKKTPSTNEEAISTMPSDPQGGEFTPPKEDNSNVEVPMEKPKTNETLETPKENEGTIENDTTFEAFDHNSYNLLLQNHVSQEGNVDYKAFKNNSSQLKNYINSLGENMPTSDWSKEDKLAYWINAYNAMTIDLIVRHYPTNSIKDIDKPWQQRYWKLGDKWYNLDEIEHQIIRKMGEPRIHFALVCAAKSCPKLYNKAFTAKTLDEDLSKLTREFLADDSKNNISENAIKLSKIFKWFAKDFKQDGSLVDFLNQYTNISISSKAKKSFKDYNWDLND